MLLVYLKPGRERWAFVSAYGPGSEGSEKNFLIYMNECLYYEF